MAAPLTKALVKIFGKGFYRAHAGALLFLFITVINYCFFIKTAGSLPTDALTYFQLIITITLITSPAIMLLFFALLMIYTVKSWQFAAGLLLMDEHQFLFYSSTSLNKVKQFKSWFFVQLLINIPAIIYALFALVIGILHQHYTIPLIILLYILFLTILSAAVYVFMINRFRDGKRFSFIIRLSGNGNKPFFSLFLYHLSDKGKLAYLITKLLSISIAATGLFYLFEDVRQDARAAGIVMLTVIMTHVVLIYKAHYFEETFLGFVRNMPYKRYRIFLNFSITFLVLLVPEIIWLYTRVSFFTATGLLLFGTGIALFFRSLLFLSGLKMNKFLFRTFLLFLVMVWLILYGLIWWLTPVVLLLAFTFFYNNYYRLQASVIR